MSTWSGRSFVFATDFDMREWEQNIFKHNLSFTVAYAENFRGEGQSIGEARGGPKERCLPPNL